MVENNYISLGNFTFDNMREDLCRSSSKPAGSDLVLIEESKLRFKAT